MATTKKTTKKPVEKKLTPQQVISIRESMKKLVVRLEKLRDIKNLRDFDHKRVNAAIDDIRDAMRRFSAWV